MTEPWRQHWTRHRPPRGQEARARIPSTLHFNFKINLLAAPWDALSWPLRLMHANVHRTIELHPNATVNFFNDTQCRAALLNHRLGAALARSFDTEEDGRLRSDMCRLAQLASSGGFYFDTDLGVRGDMRRILDQRTTLAVPEAHQEDPSGTSGNAPGFFQAFLAVSPGHPVIELALERHAAWYAAMARGDEVEVTRVTRGLHRPNVGTVLLRDAFIAWAGTDALHAAQRRGLVLHGAGHVSQLFAERPQRDAALDGFELPTGHVRHGLCSYVVCDAHSKHILFLSRIASPAGPCSWGGGAARRARWKEGAVVAPQHGAATPPPPTPPSPWATDPTQDMSVVFDKAFPPLLSLIHI